MPLMLTTVQAQIPSSINKNKDHVYTGPDIFLSRTKTCTVPIHLAFTWDQRTWTNFWAAKCTSLKPEKVGELFDRHGFSFVRTRLTNWIVRATFFLDNAVKATYSFPGCRGWSHIDTTATEFARIHVIQ